MTAIRSSRFGVVILCRRHSCGFRLDETTAARWTSHAKRCRRTVVVADWHDVTAQDVRAYSPSLADKVAVCTADTSIAEIAAHTAGLVRGGND